MSLNPSILDQFRKINRATADTTEYHGPYNTLLTNLFPASSYFQTVLNTSSDNNAAIPGSIRSTTTTFIVTQQGSESRPVFFINIKPLYAMQDVDERIAADTEMRETFRYLESDLRLPRLYGLSAMGTRFAIYEYTTAGETIVPSYEASAEVRDRWRYDIMESEGEQKLLEAAEAVKSMCG